MNAAALTHQISGSQQHHEVLSILHQHLEGSFTAASSLLTNIISEHFPS